MLSVRPSEAGLMLSVQASKGTLQTSSTKTVGARRCLCCMQFWPLIQLTNGRVDLKDVIFDLLFALGNLPAARKLASRTGRGKLRDDILRLMSTVASRHIELDRIRPLLDAALANDLDDALVWDRAYYAVAEHTPPPQQATPSSQQTPWVHKTSSLVNTSEFRRDVDKVLSTELDPDRVDVCQLHDAYFRGVAGLDTASEAVFNKCLEGNDPLFGSQGWSGWPPGAEEAHVLTWLGKLIPTLEEFAGDRGSTPIPTRSLLIQPKTPLPSSVGKRSMDVGFVRDKASKFRYDWPHVLVVGELKSNPSADSPPGAWIDITTYAREVLAAQDTRRFVLGFTLCGSLMRIWAFDRLGIVMSEQFDINKDGMYFVTTMLGFMWMCEEDLGFDPTFKTAADGQRFIEITRSGSTERIVIDGLMQRARCVVGRGSTCWKAHREGYPHKLVVKDSWQPPERDEEGELLREATNRGVVNVARYYHHETVQVRGTDDDVRSNVRRALVVVAKMPKDATPLPSQGHGSSSSITGNKQSLAKATAIPPEVSRSRRDSSRRDSSHHVSSHRVSSHRVGSTSTSNTSNSTSSTNNKQPPAKTKSILLHSSRSHASSSNSIAGTKRPLCHISSAAQLRTKRHQSTPPKDTGYNIPNRVHRRVILCDYGKPIHKASSRSALLAALHGCIQGHESLHKAGILHRDISIGNLIINEDIDNNPSWPSFIIDLDLAIQEQRQGASGAKGKTGTRAFMAIGALLGEQHSFMHDLESFFWVLFWICVHYDAQGKDIGASMFEKWNYEGDDALVSFKLGVALDEGFFLRLADKNFTLYYRSLIPWVNRLRRTVFPGKRWTNLDPELYSSMKDVLSKAQEDPEVLADE